MWKSLGVKKIELCLQTTLTCGQSFRWIPTGDSTWTSLLGSRLVSLQQKDEDVLFFEHFEDGIKKEDVLSEKLVSMDSILFDYFNLGIKLSSLYDKWQLSDPYFARLAPKLSGVRILRQDPIENLFSFICSQNNHISRITTMIEKLCTRYGSLVAVHNGRDYYGFPSVEKLAHSSVGIELRQLGFGYRADYIQKAAEYLISKGDPLQWLLGLRDLSHDHVHVALCEIPGVGPKVADCVCLMSLDKHNAVPIDTHMWQIAQRVYRFKRANGAKMPRNLSTPVYNEVGNYFRLLFGDYAGWAQTVLFTADLRQFNGIVQGANLENFQENRNIKISYDDENNFSVTSAATNQDIKRKRLLK